MTAAPTSAAWDLTALLNAADPKASRPQRHLWLVRLVEWLRHGQIEGDLGATSRPVLRLKLLLNSLERNPQRRERIVALSSRFWHETDLAALLADFGFTARRHLIGEIGERLSLRLLPGTPDTDDGATLFQLIFTASDDYVWLAAIDDDTLARLATLLGEARGLSLDAAPGAVDGAAPGRADDWPAPVLQAITWLISAIRSAAFAPGLRQRMGSDLLAERSFEKLVRSSEDLVDAVLAGDGGVTAQRATHLRMLLQRCRTAAASVLEHLDEHGVSVHIVFEVEQLLGRCQRLEALISLAVSDRPQRELQSLMVELAQIASRRRTVRALLGRQYSLMARKVAERHAEAGEHYITRTRAEYFGMLRAAVGGGAVIGITTFAKFGILAIGLVPFWSGVGTGLNYAISFLIVYLLHWTVATKQPAMTAPAMAEKLGALQLSAYGSENNAASHSEAIEAFVDEVTHLVRSQIAGIVGNLVAVVPVVLLVQWSAWWLIGAPVVGEKSAHYVLHSLTLLGPTAFYAAFTGVLLFASSLVAGWTENWFVYHRLDSALEHNPSIVARLSAPRAARWSRWWRANISGVSANVSLGLLLGVVPALMAFVGLPIEVRHVTLGAGQLAAAASAIGWHVLDQNEFWWCVGGLTVTGLLNLGVSFWLALKVALRSRGITLGDRQRVYGAIRHRLYSAPLSFILPGR